MMLLGWLDYSAARRLLRLPKTKISNHGPKQNFMIRHSVFDIRYLLNTFLQTVHLLKKS